MRTSRSEAALAAAPGSLAGRVVLVAGAGGALGAETCRALARAGATVVLLGKRVPALEQRYDELIALGAPTPAIYPMDLAGASAAQHAELAQAIERECGRLDAVVHAAARFDGLAPLAVARPEDVAATLAANLSGPMLLTQACLPLLARQRDAALVFVLDDPERQRRAYWGAYGVAKAGLAALAAILHDELENGPVRVHAVRPPALATRLRATAYLGDKPGDAEPPHRTAATIAALVGPEGASWRGTVLELAPA